MNNPSDLDIAAWLPLFVYAAAALMLTSLLYNLGVRVTASPAFCRWLTERHGVLARWGREEADWLDGLSCAPMAAPCESVDSDRTQPKSRDYAGSPTCGDLPRVRISRREWN